MTDLLFYHLQTRPLADVLPTLIERCLARKWVVVVQSSTQERVAALDDLLWSYDDASFLPHGTSEDANAASQPVLLTTDAGNLNGATVRFLLEGAPLPADPDRYERIVVMFDGNDPDAVSQARETWRLALALGLTPTYWQQREDGGWEKRA